MNRRRPYPTEPRLIAWERDLTDREEALAAEQARFDDYVATIEQGIDAWAGREANDALVEAVELIARAFPQGIHIAPASALRLNDRPAETVH
ncbi:hypothetical protein EON82_25500 [bacterium]|nr:MAG: hypothetical protein EON82_25500 [bacterium]